MNAVSILRYGTKTVLDTVADLTPEEWGTVGATSAWTPKDAIAHLTSYELVLEEVLRTFVSPGSATPLRDRLYGGQRFNDEEIAARKDRSVADVLREFTKAAEQVQTLARQIPAGRWRENGTLPWYGAEYCLDDYVVYAIYAHQREHSGMIKLWLKNIRRH